MLPPQLQDGIVVYRNPLEQQMWNSIMYHEFPFILFFIAFAVGTIVSFLLARYIGLRINMLSNNRTRANNRDTILLGVCIAINLVGWYIYFS